ncbi:MAG: hypothetical protein HUU37_07915 [Bdellovibrionales bacterium]|nr:hypothetical protein [Bdellovibrionales bacterium]
MRTFLPTALLLLSAALPVTIWADTNVPPKNVRVLVYQYVNANVPGSFGSTGVEQDFSVKETLGTSVIKSISSDVAAAWDELHKVSPKLAEEINLGKVDLEPEIKIKANVLGLAWGLTDKLMVAVGAPIMSASVNVKGGYIDTNALKGTASALRAVTDPSVASKAAAFAQALEQLPTLRGEYLQGVIVNEFGYKPVGNWRGEGLGDTTVFAQYRFSNHDIFKHAVKGGAELPTGRKDDPDNLVDVPFGTGYVGSFVESLNDFYVWDDKLMLTGNAKYQINWRANREFRLAPSYDFPLSSWKETILYNPGDYWQVQGEIGSKVGYGVGFYTQYTIKNKGKDGIHGARGDYDYGILEHRTNSRTETWKSSITYSTVPLYMKGRFPVPFKVGLARSRVVQLSLQSECGQTV